MLRRESVLQERTMAAPALITPPIEPEDRQRLATAADQVASGAHLRIAGTGQEVALTEPLTGALLGLLTMLAQGEAVWLVPQRATLTSQQASEMSGIPRQTLMRAMDAGHLPFQRKGKMRRVVLADLLAYQEERVNRRAALRELTQLSEESGLYDR
jgi:excisionase family DNA binding protein